jgi:NAD(P)-dependent dehydrogenase (short-subunit alcohol dehydrogenase family)
MLKKRYLKEEELLQAMPATCQIETPYMISFVVLKQMNPESILINNAGTILRKPAVEHPDEYWHKVIETNLSANFILSREIGKEMV